MDAAGKACLGKIEDGLERKEPTLQQTAKVKQCTLKSPMNRPQ
jgi:hypothetical protein